MKESKTKGNGDNGKIKRKRVLILVLIFIFLYNIAKFLNTDGSDIPIISILFNMIFILGIVIFFLHQEEIIDQNTEMKTAMEKYSKEIKITAKKSRRNKN